jgi:hypothetical protein
MRAKILFLSLLIACGLCAQVSEGIEKNKVYQSFSGGMMLQMDLQNALKDGFKQRERVRKGWFPMNPKHKNEY